LSYRGVQMADPRGIQVANPKEIDQYYLNVKATVNTLQRYATGRNEDLPKMVLPENTHNYDKKKTNDAFERKIISRDNVAQAHKDLKGITPEVKEVKEPDPREPFQQVKHELDALNDQLKTLYQSVLKGKDEKGEVVTKEAVNDLIKAKVKAVEEKLKALPISAAVPPATDPVTNFVTKQKAMLAGLANDFHKDIDNLNTDLLKEKVRMKQQLFVKQLWGMESKEQFIWVPHYASQEGDYKTNRQELKKDLEKKRQEEITKELDKFKKENENKGLPPEVMAQELANLKKDLEEKKFPQAQINQELDKIVSDSQFIQDVENELKRMGYNSKQAALSIGPAGVADYAEAMNIVMKKYLEKDSCYFRIFGDKGDYFTIHRQKQKDGQYFISAQMPPGKDFPTDIGEIKKIFKQMLNFQAQTGTQKDVISPQYSVPTDGSNIKERITQLKALVEIAREGKPPREVRPDPNLMAVIFAGPEKTPWYKKIVTDDTVLEAQKLRKDLEKLKNIVKEHKKEEAKAPDQKQLDARKVMEGKLAPDEEGNAALRRP
jgi:hypothetical protein